MVAVRCPGRLAAALFVAGLVSACAGLPEEEPHSRATEEELQRFIVGKESANEIGASQPSRGFSFRFCLFLRPTIV